MEPCRPAGQHHGTGDGHLRRLPGDPEAVTGGRDTECPDVLTGDMVAGRLVRPRARRLRQIPYPEGGDGVEGRALPRVPVLDAWKKRSIRQRSTVRAFPDRPPPVVGSIRSRGCLVLPGPRRPPSSRAETAIMPIGAPPDRSFGGMRSTPVQCRTSLAQTGIGHVHGQRPAPRSTVCPMCDSSMCSILTAPLDRRHQVPAGMAAPGGAHPCNPPPDPPVGARAASVFPCRPSSLAPDRS